MQKRDRALPSVKAIRIAAFAAVVAATACAEVEDTIDGASALVDRLFGVESEGAAPASEAAERAYRDGLAARESGAEQAAVKHLSDAADLGHLEAQNLLARAFANGRGVPKNLAWAARWYGKAAAEGLVDAQFSYGVARASGLGLPRNRVRGYAWLLLAERGGHAKAHAAGDALAKKMTPEQVTRAKARADKFEAADDPRFADPPTVMYVEQVLNGLGFDAGPVDGRTGKRTRGAIRKYQESRGLPADGRVTPELLRRLLEEQNPGA